MKTKKVLLVLMIAGLGMTGLLTAQVYDVTLTGGQQVPANASVATGSCLVYYDGVTAQLSVVCSHDIPDVTAAHIHRGAVGQSGPVVLGFPAVTSPFKSVFDLPPALIADLEAGLLYVAIHSTTYPAGELRGQIGPAADAGVYFPVEGSQVVPPVGTDASGACIGALNTTKTGFKIGCTSDVLDVTGVGILQGEPGEAGPPVFFLNAGTTILDSVDAAAFGECPDFGDFLEDMYWNNLYVNVFSATYPEGELRGQIPAPASAMYFAQFGNGGGIGGAQSDANPTLTSSIVLTNTSTTTEAQGTIYFMDELGQPLTVGLRGSGIVGPGGVLGQGAQVSEINFDIPPLGVVAYTTDGAGPLVVGSAKVIANQPLGGIVRFRIGSIGIAGFGAAESVHRAIAPIRVDNEVNTALAIRNNESFPLVVDLSLRTVAGDVLFQESLTIPANGRAAQFITEIFEGAPTDDLLGTVVIEAASGGFSAIALELGHDPGQFTSLPVTPVVGP